MYIDFAFLDPSGHLLLFGWSEGIEDPVLITETQQVEPVRLLRFPRYDLETAEPLAFAAVFAFDGAGEPNVTVEIPTLSLELDPERFIEDERFLVETGVDETFHAYLKVLSEIGATRRGVTAQNINARLTARAQPAQGEGLHFAFGIDIAMITHEGLGLVEGWVLGHDSASTKLTALAVSNLAVVPVQFELCRVREDLADYAGRYLFTGRDGFAATFRMGTNDSIAQIAFLSDEIDHARSVLVHPITTAQEHRLLQVFGEGIAPNPQSSATERLISGFRAPVPVTPISQRPSDTGRKAPELALIVNVDVLASDMRDVLRHALDVINVDVEIIPVVSDSDPQIRTYCEMAISEHAEKAPHQSIRLGPMLQDSLASDVLEVSAKRFIYGAASALFQLLTARVSTARAFVLLDDPQGAQEGGYVNPYQDALLEDGAGFVIGAKTGDLVELGCTCLSLDYFFRQLAVTLSAEGALQRLATLSYFQGGQGTGGQVYPGFGSRLKLERRLVVGAKR